MTGSGLVVNVMLLARQAKRLMCFHPELHRRRKVGSRGIGGSGVVAVLQTQTNGPEASFSAAGRYASDMTMPKVHIERLTTKQHELVPSFNINTARHCAVHTHTSLSAIMCQSRLDAVKATLKLVEGVLTSICVRRAGRQGVNFGVQGFRFLKQLPRRYSARTCDDSFLVACGKQNSELQAPHTERTAAGDVRPWSREPLLRPSSAA